MDSFIGTIMMFGFNFAPRGWAQCQGQLLSVSQNTALFSLLGTTYGGDGRTTFGLPDLRGRAPLGEGHAPGLSNYPLGQKAGTESETITVNEMPPHTHEVTATATMNAERVAATSSNPGGRMLAAPQGTSIYADDAPANNVALASDAVQIQTTVGQTGGGQPINLMQPYVALNFCICLQGIFPSRD